MRNSKRLIVAVMIAASFVALRGDTGSSGGTPVRDEARIAGLLNDMRTADLASLPALPVARYVLPPAGVDVMRVRIEETYHVAGVGKDTVELTGWIAARHDTPRPAEGETDIRWGTAIVDTEFVGLELEGNSSVFGPVRISLDRSVPSNGAVGKLSIPFYAQMALEQAYRPLRSANASATIATASQPPPAGDPGARMKGPEREVFRTMQQLWAAISKRDVKAMSLLYSKTGQNMFFGTPGTGLKFKGADPYLEAVAKQFANVKDIKVTPRNEDLDIKVFGRFAVVAVTGRNDVTDLQGQTGSAEWRATVRMQQEGTRWLITHDHTSFAPGGGKGLADIGGKCLARLRVDVSMPQLALNMKTENPVLWYSEVDTIPPVGYTASVSAAPTRMISQGRAVATLQGGAVRFREIVRQVPLEGTKLIATR